jgi:hypothetical protein
MLPLVLEHPKLMLAESKKMTETLRKIYKASSDFIGDASLSAEQQVALKTRSLCPLLADNPWEPSANEDDLIQQIALEDRGIDAIPADGSDERTKHDNIVVQYSRAMAYLREILNHTFLRTVFHTSSKQAKLEYQEVQRNFINDHSNDDPNDPVVKFTALDIIRYIESDCICSNDKALQSIHNSISKMVRHNNQSLLDWLQSFVPPMNKFLKATHQQVLDTTLRLAASMPKWTTTSPRRARSSSTSKKRASRQSCRPSAKRSLCSSRYCTSYNRDMYSSSWEITEPVCSTPMALTPFPRLRVRAQWLSCTFGTFALPLPTTSRKKSI